MWLWNVSWKRGIITCVAIRSWLFSSYLCFKDDWFEKDKSHWWTLDQRAKSRSCRWMYAVMSVPKSNLGLALPVESERSFGQRGAQRFLFCIWKNSAGLIKRLSMMAQWRLFLSTNNCSREFCCRYLDFLWQTPVLQCVVWVSPISFLIEQLCCSFNHG